MLPRHLGGKALNSEMWGPILPILFLGFLIIIIYSMIYPPKPYSNYEGPYISLPKPHGLSAKLPNFPVLPKPKPSSP